MPWWKRKKKIVPQFTVTVLISNTPITTIDVNEDAVLIDARKEIELSSTDFPELQIEYFFRFNGLKCPSHYESKRKVREATGPDSRLSLLPKIDNTKIIPVSTNQQQQEQQNSNTRIETIKDNKKQEQQQQQRKQLLKINEERDPEEIINNIETAIDTTDEVTTTITDNLTEEISKVELDGTITTENETKTLPIIQLDDASLAILNDVLDGIDVIAEVFPFAKIFITTCKTIYDRCQEPERLRVEIQDFLSFLKIIERNIIKGLKNFQEKEPLKLINGELTKATTAIEDANKRTGFMAWWNSKNDREHLLEIREEIMRLMKIAQFTMQIDMKEDIVKMFAKDDALRMKLMNTSNNNGVETSSIENALQTILNDSTLKNEILNHLQLNEDDLKFELNEIKQGIQKIEQKQDEMLRKLNISLSLKNILDPLNFNLEIDGAVQRFHDGTREWAFQDFDIWVKNKTNSRGFVLTSDAGMGKTGIMSKLVRTRTGCVIAHHFCRHDDSRKRNPKHVLCSIAYQLATRITRYREHLEQMDLTNELLADLNVTALFDKILREPLSCMTKSPFKTRQIILIDALDECDRNGKNDLLQCIREHFLELPEWLGFFLTTRPEVNIMKALKKFKPEPLIANSEKNMNDIKLYIRDNLTHCIAKEELDEGVEILSEKSNGVFIYARYAVEKLNPQGEMSIDELKEFPDGITGFYDIQFKRLLGGNYQHV